MVKRYRLLNSSLPAPNRVTNSLTKRFRGLDSYEPKKKPGSIRRSDIERTFGLLVMRHLEYTSVAYKDQLRKTFPVIEDYFCGSWWEEDSDFRSTKSTKGAFRQGWLITYAQSALICLLFRKKSLLARISDELRMGMRDSSVEFDLLEGDLYLSLGSTLANNPLDGVVRNEKRIQQSRNRRVKLLYDCWDALRNKEQDVFERKIHESLELHTKVWEGHSTFLRYIACFESTLVLLSNRYRMKAPELPEKLEALLLTKKTIEC